ncbi:TonB-dependent receptor [Erythrobacter sp. 3-20A1M]|uniref:TonB-dependent receptor n=1 Tax=Erythrobacter sp. 3-20A1M TaxID=2653850 RepID=UPI00352FFE4A
MRLRCIWFLCAALVALGSTAAMARKADLAVPGGTLSEVAIAVARKTGSSIVIADRAVARRRVAGVHGRMDAAAAVDAIARRNGLKAVRVGTNAWRLEARDPPPPAKRQPRQSSRQMPPPPPPIVQEITEGPPIIVIASKRESRLRDLPGQVSLLDGQSLELGGVGGTEKIAQRIATVSSTYLGSGRNKLFIRGIADSSFTGPTQATVGQYLGDLRLSYNAPDPDLRLSDMERVEVLEGPQGTLYGAGSLGGIIRLVPNAPEFGETTFSAIVGGSAVSHGSPGFDTHATLNLPVAAGAALRLNGDLVSQGGYIDKPYLGRRDVDRTRIAAGRAALRVELAPDWTIDLLALGQDTDARDSQYADRDSGGLVSSARVQEGARATYGHGQIVISGRIGAVRLRSSTGVAGQNLRERYDATWPGDPARLFVQNNDTRMIANETRVWQPLGERFGWLIGGSFLHNRTRLTRSLGTDGASMVSTGVLNTIDELTGYGEASLRLFGPVIASAGLRATRAHLGGAGEDVAPQLALAGREITARRDETAYLPSASLLVQVAPRGRIYARYQEGFRPGGLAVAGAFVSRFRSDHVSTMEIGGAIGEPGRGTFDLAANLSYTDWHNIQADFIDITGLPTTANVGDGRIWAVSVSGGARLAPRLKLEFGASYNDSRVDEPVYANAARLSQIPNIARFSGRLALQWSHDLTDDLRLDASGRVNYIGPSRLGVGPDLGELQGDYLDTGVLVRVGGDRFGVTASISNLADTRGNRFALGTPFATGREQVTPLEPRTVRIGFDARF